MSSTSLPSLSPSTNLIMPSTSLPQSKTVNILVIGDGNVGKTAYLERVKSGVFLNASSESKDEEVKVLTFNTNHGLLETICHVFNFLPESSDLENKSQEYNGCIIMFDVMSASSFKTVKGFHDQVKAKYPPRSRDSKAEIPIVVCGNKVDLRNTTGCKEGYNFRDALEYSKDLHLLEISALSNYNLEKPFSHLFTKIFGNPTFFLPLPSV